MKVGVEWYGNEEGQGSDEHVLWTKMDEVPFPGDTMHFKIERGLKPKRVLRRAWCEDDQGQWHVELVVR
jgi:hypothetical protein